MNGMHRKFTCFITIIAILLLFISQYPHTVRAQETVKLSEYKVLTIDGKDAQEPLMAGATYKVNFTIEVGKEVSDTIVLATDLRMVGDRYWELKGEYKGINVATWGPGRRQISFRSDEGKANLILTGAIPENFNALMEVEIKDKEGKAVKGDIDKLPTGKVIHQKKAMTLLRLSTESRTISQEKKMEVIDKSIETYRTTLAAKKDLLEAQKGEEKYVEMVGAIIKKAEDLAAKGLTDEATAMLKDIPDKGWPPPPASSTYLYMIMGLLAILALLFFFLMFKARGSAGYTHQVIEDQVKKLDIISVRAGRLGDKALVQEINTVKDELERVSR